MKYPALLDQKSRTMEVTQVSKDRFSLLTGLASRFKAMLVMDIWFQTLDVQI